MSDTLDRLADALGIETRYWALSGEEVFAGDETKAAILTALGVDVSETGERQSLRPALGGLAAPNARCFVPGFLEEGRCWGVACQLYGLRTSRNWGMGDFEDLARLAEMLAADGADFLGVNPLHALFLALPERVSPFYPSSRRFLNPLYIAVDDVPGFSQEDQPPQGWLDEARAATLVDYPGVTRHKLAALWRIFNRERERILIDQDFARFRERGGQALYDHALFEALSLGGLASPTPGGWHIWGDDFHSPESAASRGYAEENSDAVLFQMWLQFTADTQLAEAQRRARRAGMRIGLYLDLAVGVAPDGSATWTDTRTTVNGMTVGAPPDYFNANGQDWGLAPLSPAGLLEDDLKPFRALLDSLMCHAGAIRIDHAMGLYRQFWIPQGLGPAKGAYMRYPLTAMLAVLAEVSQAYESLVIGEDLGVVPDGFREVMRDTALHAYKVFLFEREESRFRGPQEYPPAALACVTTHDTPSLLGWWTGHDIDVRLGLDLLRPDQADSERQQRAADRGAVRRLLAEHGLGEIDADDAEVSAGEAAVRISTLVARSPSRLFAVSLDDLAGARDQLNVPGTMDEHPNWRRRLPVDLDELRSSELYRRTIEALREERPQQ
ncbi:4-alpha-glucanotransferase [Rhodopseudomonas julia]|uniref:4-alpha-glucanotransferase n=1 Tax=Rhodopseudomonas julia TaxID=200617 RepID=A0ABU0C5V8_9BRAD|nr:4-alpha-glucanotransferase [Rhodopseudomonas julia]MDQ0325296.1 4-alpha-glucanotransferase [Rhodopseudomonas julia]